MPSIFFTNVHWVNLDCTEGTKEIFVKHSNKAATNFCWWDNLTGINLEQWEGKSKQQN